MSSNVPFPIRASGAIRKARAIYRRNAVSLKQITSSPAGTRDSESEAPRRGRAGVSRESGNFGPNRVEFAGIAASRAREVDVHGPKTIIFLNEFKDLILTGKLRLPLAHALLDGVSNELRQFNRSRVAGRRVLLRGAASDGSAWF
jgi:hypothetical protein